MKFAKPCIELPSNEGFFSVGIRSIVERDRPELDRLMRIDCIHSTFRPWENAAKIHESSGDNPFWERFNFGKLAFTRKGDVIGACMICESKLVFFVNPAYWRRGLGGLLVDSVCDFFFSTQPMGPLSALVLRENIASKKLLERNRFFLDTIEKTSFGGRTFPLTVLSYIRHL